MAFGNIEVEHHKFHQHKCPVGIDNVDINKIIVSNKVETFMKLNIWLFLIKDEELLEKYNKIWDKISNSIRKGFDSKPVYNEKYLKFSSFHGVKMPKEGFQYICVSAILIDSVFRTGKNYNPQVLLEECKQIVKIKMPKYITDD